MQRAPAIVALLLFVALCASIAYWLLQWLAPEPRAVAAPPDAARPQPSASAAAALFGGRPQTAGGAQVQLRGILLAGRASVAIIAAEGRPVRALRVDADVLPGLTVKEIGARKVVLSERGMERELSLPAFAAQEGGAAVMQAGVAPEPAPQPNSPQAQQTAPLSAGAGGLGRSADGEGSRSGAPATATPAPGPLPLPRRSPAAPPSLQ